MSRNMVNECFFPGLSGQWARLLRMSNSRLEEARQFHASTGLRRARICAVRRVWSDWHDDWYDADWHIHPGRVVHT